MAFFLYLIHTIRYNRKQFRRVLIMLRYLSYDNLNIDEELAKIEKSDSAEIVLDQRNKKCLFD